MAKKLKIGSLLANKRTFNNGGKEVEKTLISLALGSMKNKDPKYNLSVTLIVKDHTGKIVHQQDNGFVNMVDPRSQPDELFAAGLITADQYAEAKERVSRIPESIKYSLEVPSRS